MRRALRLYFTTNVVLLVLLGVTFPFLERGSGSWAISIVSLTVVVASLVVSGLAIRLDVALPWPGET